MRIVLIGTGNLATRLGLALIAKKAEIVQVYGRNLPVTDALANLLGCHGTTKKSELITNAALYILAVNEDAIPEILQSLPIRNQLIVHTSGSVPMDLLANFTDNYGVFYPLQTFSAKKAVDFGQIPICIEANNDHNLSILTLLANSLSTRVMNVNSTQRRELHLAAVFVCNFTNHMFAIGHELLSEYKLDFELLKPLILETVNKAMEFPPAEVQTGPAIRGNQPIMELHQKLLENHPEWQKLYNLISLDIQSIRK